MQKSYVTLEEEVRKLLLRFPDLVDSLQSRDDQFPRRFEHWLKEGEETMKKNGIVECARLAGFRSKLLIPLHEDKKKISVRKRQTQIASELLFDAQNTLLDLCKPIESRLNNCRDIINQILGVIHQTGSVRYDSNEGFEAFVNKLWSLLTTHEQLKPGMLKVFTLVSQGDARRLLAEEINLEDWSG